MIDLSGLDNLAYKVLAVDRVAFLDLQPRYLSMMRSGNNHFL